jgi:hypothetical protein
MKQITSKLSIFFTLSVILVTINSCKKTFDAPPAPSDPNLTVTHTIAQLKAMHTVAGSLDMINSDMIIAGTVIANDKSGNLYKTIYIQDATGAIQLSLDASGLFNSYPVGRKIYVKCKGLCVSDYNNMIQLGVKATVSGTPSFQAIASNLIGQYVIGGSVNNSVPIKTVTIADLKTNMQDSLLGTLIRLENFEFSDTSKTFADTSAYKNDANLDIRNCSGGSIIIRTSGYANFAGVKAPGGNGSVVALYTVFRTTRQLVLRDTSDLQLKGARCNLFEENFQGYTSSGTSPLNLPGWYNIQETGDVPYTMATFGSNVFPKVSAFASTQLPTTNISSWLITPGINIPTGLSPKFTFTCARRYPAGTFKVYVSDNFNGNNVSTANWQLLTTVPGGPSNAFTPFDLFGPFDFSSYAGKKIYIGFRYEAAAGTSKFDVGTYEPDDIKISSK